MDYFTLKPDGRVAQAIQPLGVPKASPGTLSPENRGDGNGEPSLPVQYFLQDSPDPEYVDLLEKPLWLISDRLKQLLAKYEPALRFEPVMLADRNRMRQELYWRMTVPSVDCLAAQSEFTKNGGITKLVIDKAKVKGAKVFSVSKLRDPLLLVGLDVAESILRRDFCGIRLVRVAQSCPVKVKKE